MEPLGLVAELPRGVIARLRVLGTLEFFSLLPGLGVVLLVSDGSLRRGADLPWAIAFAGITIGVRVLVATEYVRATQEALEWRSLFRSYRVGWAQVADVRLGELWMFPHRPSGERCIEVEFANGATRRLRAAAGCGDAARSAFVARAAHQLRALGTTRPPA